MGWLIEGALIPLVYDAPPISFVWPSLGWHMTITFGVAWVALPWVMRNAGWGSQLAIYSGAGFAWAGWGHLFFRGGRGDDAPRSGGFLRAGGRRGARSDRGALAGGPAMGRVQPRTGGSGLPRRS